jgi:phosphatidylglycerophosphate synthase
MSDKALSTLRADALLYVGAIGVVLAAILGVVTSVDGLTVGQVIVALAAYVALGLMTVATLAAHRPLRHFGAANALTLARGAVVVTLAGFLAGPIDTTLAWVASLLGFLCIALDGVDGWLARRSATVSAFGARFDMEVDALLMLVLSLLLMASGAVGAWVLLIGAARYLFVAAGWLVPTLRAPLPYSERRRVVCVVQGLALVLALVPILPPVLATLVAAVGVAATAWSFGIDIRYLLQGQTARSGATRAPADPGVRR